MADSINTINVGGIDKEVEDTVARNSGSNANSRCTTLESDVSNLAARVEEIIAPTGEAPSPAEILDARVGEDDIIYNSLGIAIRKQVKNLKETLNKIDASRNVPVSNRSVIGYGATGTLENGLLTFTVDNTSNWQAIGVQGLISATIKTAEYVMIAHGTDGTYDYALAVCTNDTDTGKLFLFRLRTGTFKKTKSAVVGGSYTSNTSVTIEKLNDYTVKITYNNTETVVDVNNYLTIGGMSAGHYDLLIWGRCNKKSSYFQIKNTKPSFIEMSDDIVVKSDAYPVQTSDLIGYGGAGTVNKDTVTNTSEDDDEWSAVGFIPIRKYVLKRAEYTAIAHGTNGSNDYILSICTNDTDTGKLFLFLVGHQDSGYYRSSNKVVDGEYNSNAELTLEKINDFTLRVIYSGVETIINLNDYRSISSSPTVKYDSLFFGIVNKKPRTWKIDSNNYCFVEYNALVTYVAELINRERNGWEGKKWFAFGDSITAGGHYISTVNNILGTISTKFGYGGYTYSELENVYTDMIGGDTPDVITLFAGTNDFGHSNTVEAMTESLENIIQGLYANYPKVTLIIITPLQRDIINPSSRETAGLGPNNHGKYLIDYVNAIKEIAQKYSIPCLDFYSCGGINKYNINEKSNDRLHPNPSYGVILGNMIAQFIKQTTPFN